MATGNAATVVGDRDRVVLVDDHVNFVAAVAGQGFVDGVVDHFPQALVETGGRGVTDVHAGALAHSFQTFQHLDAFGVIITAILQLNFTGICSSAIWTLDKLPRKTG